MEMWAWLAAYVLGFAVLQVYLYMYFTRGQSTQGEVSTEGTTRGISEGTATSVTTPEGMSDTDLVNCENCGAYNENDPMFTYCKRCGDRLE
jgi:hypothetical protein